MDLVEIIDVLVVVIEVSLKVVDLLVLLLWGVLEVVVGDVAQVLRADQEDDGVLEVLEVELEVGEGCEDVLYYFLLLLFLVLLELTLLLV